MRTRLLTALTAVALSALVLTACSGEPEPPLSTPDASAEPRPDCLIDLPAGEVSNAIVVEGEGTSAVVSIPEGTEFVEMERTILSEGTGREVIAGDLISIRFQIVEAATGEVLDSTERGEDGLLPILLDPQAASLFVVALECEPLGSQVVMALPGTAMGPDASDLLVYAEAVDFLPLIATGAPVDPVAGMPTVELDADGSPTITIPDTAAPAETEVAVLQQGDGPTVEPGDLVVVQYRGVKWGDGEEFDSSWSRGMVTQFPTTGVVTGFRLALEGYQVGSQVLVVMPPEDGYGAIEGHALQEETLVFVVDILATSPLEQ